MITKQDCKLCTNYVDGLYVSHSCTGCTNNPYYTNNFSPKKACITCKHICALTEIHEGVFTIPVCILGLMNLNNSAREENNRNYNEAYCWQWEAATCLK